MNNSNKKGMIMTRTKALFIALAVSAACFAKDIQKIVFTTTPQMHCENCEKKIKNNLRFEKGVKKIETNIEKQTVTVEYDADKITAEQLLKAFSKFGYKARQLKEGEKVKKN